MPKLEITQKLQLKLKPVPQLLLTQKLLQLPIIELKQQIDEELENNPALELEELPEEFYEPIPQSSTPLDDEEEQEDITSNLPSHNSLQEYLLFNIHPFLSSQKEEEVAEFLIGNINEKGFLEVTTQEVAEKFHYPEEDVEKVLNKIQQLEPSGIGARSLKESLIIQLKDYENEKPKYIEVIINNYFDELVKKQYKEISKKLNIKLDKVKEVAQFIKLNLTPYPALNYKDYFEEDTYRYINPDFVIKKAEDNSLNIEILYLDNLNLRLNPTYVKLYRELKEKGYDEKGIEHIRKYLTRAELFLRAIEERKNTLRKILEFIIDYQKGFIEGKSFLKPLTQKQLAKYVGLSPSTISRAVANKFIQLPSGRIINFSLLFDTSQYIKERIKEIIKENKKKLTDEKITQILNSQGIHIARRTVTKYRAEIR